MTSNTERKERVREIMNEARVDEATANEIFDIENGGSGDCIAVDEKGKAVPLPPRKSMFDDLASLGSEGSAWNG